MGGGAHHHPWPRRLPTQRGAISAVLPRCRPASRPPRWVFVIVSLVPFDISHHVPQRQPLIATLGKALAYGVRGGRDPDMPPTPPRLASANNHADTTPPAPCWNATCRRRRRRGQEVGRLSPSQRGPCLRGETPVRRVGMPQWGGGRGVLPLVCHVGARRVRVSADVGVACREMLARRDR